jgi:hypothetical protein
MTKLEYSDFYKFLVSLGVILIGLSLLVPWLFLRESFDALLKATDISELTPTAQTLLSYRQYAALWFVQNVWWISLSLVIGGLAPLIAGIWLWVSKQRLRDQREQFEVQKAQLEVERLRRELTPMTPTEIAMKGIQEVKEEIEVVEEAPEVSAIPSFESRIQKYFHVEQIFLNKLITCYGEERVLTQQKIKHQAYDALLLSDRPQLADVIFEIKYAIHSLRPGNLDTTIARVIRSTQNYVILTAHQATSIILFILPEDDQSSTLVDRAIWKIKDEAQAHKVRVHPIFITEEQLVEITCSDLQAKINRIATAA